MIKLYGMPLSNYHCMVKHALLEKGLSFDEVLQYPSQDESFLARSPMGKVPALETDEGTLTETSAILEYIDEHHPGPALFPGDAFFRARVRQLMKTQELYVELPSHDLIGVLFGRELPAHVLDTCVPRTRRGLAAIARLVRFSPWVAGEHFSAADIFLFYSLAMSNRLTQTVYRWDLLTEVPGLQAWYDNVAAMRVTQDVLAAHNSTIDKLLAKHRAAEQA
jgi:glutathione S-transferase